MKQLNLLNESQMQEKEKGYLTMVNFVLDDFRRPAGKRFKPRLEFFILPLHFDDFVALGFPRAGKR